jgi:hypothetical protein
MAKKQKKAKGKKGGGKKQRRAVGGNALLGTFAGGVVGKVFERLIVNEIETVIRPLRKQWLHDKVHADGDKAHDEDVASRLLTVLADGGPKGIPELLAETNVGLSKLLHALHMLRDVRLVNFVGEPGEETLEVTRSGAQAVTVLRKNDIQAQAAKLLAT